MEIVNAVYYGDLQMKIDLQTLHENIPHSKIYKSRPCMVLLKKDGGTMMFFSSGKFRIMGIVDEIEATCKLYNVFEKLRFDLPSLKTQTMTVKFLMRPVNLSSLSKLVQSRLELELFPALLITKYKPISINVFASGKVVICGIKDIEQANVIKNDLVVLFDSCT